MIKDWQRTLDQERSRMLQKGQLGDGPVVYWMSRDQRALDNWALLYAQERALALHKGVTVVFCLDLDYPAANFRHFAFLLRGLEELHATLEKANIGFRLLRGTPDIVLPPLWEELDPSLLVTDFDPLRIKKQWKKDVLQHCSMPVIEVDAHNIVPCWLASDKREYAAYTIRKKIHGLLSGFLTDFPPLQRHPYCSVQPATQRFSAKTLLKQIKDQSVGEVHWILPGERAGNDLLADFLAHGLHSYSTERNNPCVHGQSNLSPYFHFGQLAPQRAAWEVKKSSAALENKEAYLEELIIRRELSDNFCYYTHNYDRFAAFPEWARKSLDIHREDVRPYIANLQILENAATEDKLWNACQQDLVQQGKLHGYLRMYWAKKILEWSASPEEAMSNAIYLNDKYSLDGRDPSGYAGVAWSIGGVHDRAWGERPVFGKIRYMNSNGCKRKFDIAAYLRRVKKMGAI